MKFDLNKAIIIAEFLILGVAISFLFSSHSTEATAKGVFPFSVLERVDNSGRILERCKVETQTRISCYDTANTRKYSWVVK